MNTSNSASKRSNENKDTSQEKKQTKNRRKASQAEKDAGAQNTPGKKKRGPKSSGTARNKDGGKKIKNDASGKKPTDSPESKGSTGGGKTGNKGSLAAGKASSKTKGTKAKAGPKDKKGQERGKAAQKSSAIVEGILSVTARGFGFVTMDDGPDLFIPLDNMATAMDGDTVKAEVLRQVPEKKPVGRIVKVVKPAVKDLVGVFRRQNGEAVVVPDDERFKRPLDIPGKKIIPEGGERKPREGEFVLVRRERWEDTRENPRGKIIEIIGSPEDPEIDTLIVAKSKGLRTQFPQKVLAEAEALSLPKIRKEKKRREDLRDKLCFTIDPESAEDFDDAVSLEQLDDGTFELGVHIADVSHYVQEGSALDKEAIERGTSVYFVNSVIPMLPEKLSNNLCSLREGEDRLAFSVIMHIDSRGLIRDYRIAETIIRSKRRFTYREVEDVIRGKTHPYAKTIHQMMMLSLVLRGAREGKGSIDFDVPVPVISLDENGIPYEVRPSERIDANRMIEEFMLAANLTVARHMVQCNHRAAATGGIKPISHKGGFSSDAEESSANIPSSGGGGAPVGRGDSSNAKKQPWPFLYRVHEKPDENEVCDFLDLLGRLGISYKVPGELEPEDYRKILDIVENLEFKDFAEKVALRSMTKAVYSTENIGHFGLAFDAYTHFTSPIRRYPDLLVHRLLKQYAAKAASPPPAGTKARLQKICEQCSQREITAVEAEREHTKIKAMEFLAGKEGETYNGVIAGITSFGFFVELNHYLIEGLVHVSELRDDRYEFDKDNYTLTGERNGKVFRLGDPVRVTIKRVSVEERKADFILSQDAEQKR